MTVDKKAPSQPVRGLRLLERPNATIPPPCNAPIRDTPVASARKDQLVPVPWARIEPHYKAGIRSVAAIAKEFGVSRAAIYKHADKQDPPWLRNLAHEIHTKADRIVAVTAAALRPELQPGVTASTKNTRAKDSVIADAGAQLVADLRLEHQKRIRQLRNIIAAQLDALGAVSGTPELFGQVYDLLHADEALPRDTMARMVEIVAALPGQVKVTKDLTECLRLCIALEREAFGLNTSEAGQRHLVIIRDYTGKGDPDAPPRPPTDEDDPQ